MRKTRVMFILMVTASSFGWATSLTLVQKGEPCAQVVIADSAAGIVRTAAEDFTRIIQKMSGAQLPLVTESQSDSTKSRVLIGDCKTPVNLECDPAVIKGQDAYAGYVVACRDKILSLRGNSPVGTTNAVYGFLQDQLDVRWFLPTETFEIVPQRTTISIPEMRRVVTPSFVCRLSSASGNDAYTPWARHNRWDTGEGGFAVPYAAGFTHWMYAVYPPSRYAKTHPEVYPLLGGKRAIPSQDGEQLGQPCTGNPITAQLAIETINAYLDTHPECHTYPFSINDNDTWCECDLCRAQDGELPLHRGNRMHSNRWFKFVNTVARGIRAKHPDKFIGCFAYAGVELPPTDIERMEPNVFVDLTQDSAQYFDSAYQKVDYNLIRAWQKKCNHVGKYDYYGLGALVPRYFPHLLARDLKNIHSMGVRAFHSETYPYWSNMGPMLYIAARILWNVNLDPDKLLDEFFTSCFGPAAKEMKAFYEIHEGAWMGQKKGKWFNGIGSAAEQMDIYSLAQVEKALVHLKRAETLAIDDSSRKRIQFLAKGYAYPDLLLRGWGITREVLRSSVKPSNLTKTRIQTVETILASLKSEDQRWKTSIQEDPVADRWYRESARPTIRTQWRTKVQAALIQAMEEMNTWCQSAEGRNSTEVKQLIERLGSDPEIGLLWKALQGTLQLGPNLLPNPGFEESKTTTSTPTGPGWQSSASAAGWSTWQNDNARGVFYLDDKVKHSGKYAGAFQGGECLCYITTVPIETGKSYLADLWAMSPTTRESTKVTLEVRWQDAQGRWFNGAPDYRVDTKKKDVWERLMIPFIAPVGAVRAVILLVGYGIEEKDVVRYDDAFVGEAKMK